MSTLKVPLVSVTHGRYDETLGRIYIGRRFNNDSERLEKLSELWTKLIRKVKS